MNTIGQWIRWAGGQLTEAAATLHDRESASLDADLLVAHVTGLSRSQLYAFPETVLNREQQARLRDLLQRRCHGEPLAYITGEREFWSLPLTLQPGALVPRPDTELLVELTLQRLPTLPAGPVIELGTGSGAIALALSREIDDRAIIAVERHAPALQVAAVNLRQFGRQRVSLVQADWLDCMRSRSAALILANPPYLATDDPHLAALRFEPRSALVSGPTGLEDLERIIAASQRVGLPGSLLLLEHGETQGHAVRSLLSAYDFIRTETCRDLAGLDRVTLGYRPVRAYRPCGDITSGSST